jgi:hypothetical protein
MKLIALIATLITTFYVATLKPKSGIKAAIDSIGIDKYLHCIASQGLFMVLYWFCKSEKIAAWSVLVISVLVEMAQMHPKCGRGFSFGDIVANMVGVALCLVAKRVLT